MPDRALIRLNGPSEAMLAALRAASLPADDLQPSMNCYEFRGQKGAMGWAAFEPLGTEALLRSVVMTPEYRSRGMGREIVEQTVQAARQEGITRLWLLTETAEPFFAQLGFVRVPRDIAPDSIRQTGEFSSICPASASCMRLELT